MDRSFLSQPPVIAAADQFVCIRLTSYEDETEKQFIAKLVRGEVANTSFGILGPDGKQLLRGQGPGRGPRDLFADAAAMAKGMDEVARMYSPKKVDGIPALPVALSAKVGLAVAAGDNQPLVIVLADDPKRRAELEAKVAALAWDKAYRGHLTFANAASAKEFPKVEGVTVTDGVLFVEPDLFGVGGKVVKQVSGKELDGPLADAMRDTIRNHAPLAKTRRMLADLGLKEGIYYDTAIPVSGRGEAADRERYKQKLDAKGNVRAASLAQPFIVTDQWVMNDGSPIAVRQSRATPGR